MSFIEMFIKSAEKSDVIRDKGLKTPDDIKRYDDISYGIYGKWNYLDIYHKKDVVANQPTIISIHGGGWVYGDKELYQYYCMDLAKRGFTVVNFSYRLAPENKFPKALEDVNSVFNFIEKHAMEYNIDLNNLFVVGDSAGAQMASQYLAMLNNKEFAEFYDFKIPSVNVRAIALNCGIYDVKEHMEQGTNEFVIEYVGENSIDKAEMADTIKYMNKDFPPTFVMTSYYDFFKSNAKPMYDHLVSLGIPCEYKLYGREEDKYMGHVFHLNIRLDEAKICNEEECEFFKKYINNNNNLME